METIHNYIWIGQDDHIFSCATTAKFSYLFQSHISYRAKKLHFLETVILTFAMPGQYRKKGIHFSFDQGGHEVLKATHMKFVKITQRLS